MHHAIRCHLRRAPYDSPAIRSKCFHSSALTWLTLSRDCLSICILSSGCPGAPMSLSSLRKMGRANLLRNCTCTTLHLGSLPAAKSAAAFGS
ncbi:uncharacterized protein SPSK_04725 [Sporothrix schenckii 1099-18]|uniref:Uncharacterized protein n=1 Tax=Sporothrix schenckii 1099-18 TaxID=1397361 RepID=A0A0F2M1K8_SPOSC|nr:uncharacterized protein SPSK_04725 [Sporothrix schenckii 1099-18]KJR83583.1 hypothetical protein SPSK_04725 [Sporothrix schenckii 1099-18]